VQQTLEELTGIPKADQILMCEGARLEGAKSLAVYGLPGVRRGRGLTRPRLTLWLRSFFCWLKRNAHQRLEAAGVLLSAGSQWTRINRTLQHSLTLDLGLPWVAGAAGQGA
jgi:hypothetical protein